jgi:hypothetical protein
VQRRPGGVTFAGWLMGINGAFSAIGGVIVLIVASNTREMARHGLPQAALLVTGFVVLTLLTRQPGAFFAWVTGLVDVIVLVGLWGTPGAAEFFDPGRAPSIRMAPPVPPPPRL